MLRGMSRSLYRAKSTYISKHFTISPSDLSKVVGLNGYFKDYRLKQSGEMDVRTCFDDCARGNKGISDNAWKLIIRRDGSYYCYRCGAKGNWYNLKQRLTGVKHADMTDSVSTTAGAASEYYSDSGSGGRPLSETQIHQSNNGNNNGLARNNINIKGNKFPKAVLPDQREAFGYHLNLTAVIYSKEENLKSLDMLRKEIMKIEEDAIAQNIPMKVPSSLARPLVLQYLQEERGLSDQVVVRYGVGCAIHSFPVYKEEDAAAKRANNGRQIPQWTEKVCITFPWFEHKSHSVEDEDTGVISTSIMKDKKSEDPTTISTSDITKRSVAYFRPHGDTESTYYIKRLKLRALDTKGMQRTLPKGGAWGFFGWHLVQPEHKSVIITEGEYDAMAVSQGLAHLQSTHELHNIPAISLPNGCNSLPPELIPSLEQFQRIYLWMDDDKPGQEASEKFAYKLGIHRCRIVSPIEGMKNPPKDANDALRQSHQVGTSSTTSPKKDLELIPNMILSAKALNHQRLESFKNLRGEILSNIRQPENVLSGAAITSLPRLSQTIKGLRKGELVILTGPTGCGKTTLLSQVSLDLARQGAPVLWGSFEIRNAMLIEKMLKQFGGMNIKTMDHEKLERLADDFETLPLKFMNFHAGSDMSQVLEAMDFAVYRDDVQHIIIDNLQFMMPRATIPGITGAQNMNQSVGRSQFDRFITQDAVIDEFRRFATEKRVNIILVIHPRKEDENQLLGMSSIFGTAKATQEADIVLILQRLKEGMALSVKKNRYNGHIGKIDVNFNEALTLFHEVD